MGLGRPGDADSLTRPIHRPSTPLTLIEGARDARYVETGHLLYGVNGVVFAVAFDLDAREVRGGSVALIEGVQDSSFSGVVQFATSRNGSLVYVPGGAGEAEYSLVWASRTGEETPTAAPPGAYFEMRVSPDGTRVATSILDNRNFDIWLWSEQDPLTRLTFDESVDEMLLWTPRSARTRSIRALPGRAAGPRRTGATHWQSTSDRECLPKGPVS